MSSHNPDCRREEIVAYLDGELDASSRVRIELHFESCDECAAQVRVQRRLLNELNFALASDEPAFEMPKNFAEVVAARAQSDMSGVRERVERRRALGLCIALAAAAFLLLGGAAFGESVFAPLRACWKAVAALFSFLGHALYDAGAGVAVISRGLSGHLLFESRGFGALVLLLIALALFTLARLIVRYHRTRIME
ncbi:MAG TPA: zf-HC2 domain-containing protein [Pyrinomonadaceae bacterium]|nr:zf-HC2 domain-containing protein [Pyrinomonadaceae bacterium]